MTHYAPLIAALVTLLLTFVLLYSKVGKSIQDIPNERSLHNAPIPRIGGVGLIAGILSGWAIMVNDLAWWIIFPLLILFAVSLIDDIHGLPVGKRFFAHVIASVFLVVGGSLWSQGFILSLLVLLFAIWMINLYNFMDGSDGLAGGMAFFGFTIYGIGELINHNDSYAMLNFSIAAAALGFLHHNFHPAKVFMGDAGSIPLGFLVVAMGLLGFQSSAWPLWFPLMVFSPFIVDASVTLGKRALRKAQVTQAHREHYYQRAIQMGASHRNVALIEYALMLGSGISALMSLKQNLLFLSITFLLWLIIYVAIMISIDKKWSAFQRSGQVA